jgi:hypothetical protein
MILVNIALRRIYLISAQCELATTVVWQVLREKVYLIRIHLILELPAYDTSDKVLTNKEAT